MLYDPKIEKKRYCKKCNEYKIVKKDVKLCPDCKSLLGSSQPCDNLKVTKKNKHNYSIRESTHLNKDQKKKMNSPITIKFQHILIVFIAALSLFIGDIIAIFTNETPGKDSSPYYNEDTYTQNVDFKEKEIKKYIPNAKEREVKRYFNFLSSEIAIINSLEKKRKNYISNNRKSKYIEIIKNDILTIDEHKKIIKKKEFPEGFESINNNLYWTFASYENLLKAQYSDLVTNGSNYKSSIVSNEGQYIYYWKAAIENLRFTLIKNKIPFGEKNGSIFLKY